MASKSKRERRAERKQNKKTREEHNSLVASIAFSKSKDKSDDIIKNLKKISKGQYLYSDFSGMKNSTLLIELARLNHDENEICNVFSELIQKKCDKMLEDENVFKKLISVSKLKDYYIRDIKSWKRKTYNPERQFSSLVRHLFCKYEVPEFMNEAWEGSVVLNKNEKYNLLGGKKFTPVISHRIQWFLDIGNGNNIRNSKDLPISFTKKMAHLFLKAPSNFTINEAIRYAEIKSKGGDNRTVEIINETFLSRDFNNNDFWSTIIDFFIQNPMIDSARIAPILDYIKFQKFDYRREFVDGRWIELPPENPNFSIKGRNPNNILEQTEEWHERMNAIRRVNQLNSYSRRATPSNWKGLAYLNFKHVEGTNNKTTYEIVQLLKYEELLNEGRAMNHCVASYAHSCYAGRCAIFSLRKFQNHNLERMVTIEVLNDGRIVQVRGKNNRRSEQQEDKIILRWATKEGLKY
jgi:hypothetical protein